MAGTDTVLMTVRGTNGPPDLQAAAAQLGVSVDALDAAFGVVAVDPDAGLYSVAIFADRLPSERPGEPFQGPFSNPRIAPFGPVQEAPDAPAENTGTPEPPDDERR